MSQKIKPCAYPLPLPDLLLCCFVFVLCFLPYLLPASSPGLLLATDTGWPCYVVCMPQVNHCCFKFEAQATEGLSVLWQWCVLAIAYPAQEHFKLERHQWGFIPLASGKPNSGCWGDPRLSHCQTSKSGAHLEIWGVQGMGEARSRLAVATAILTNPEFLENKSWDLELDYSMESQWKA